MRVKVITGKTLKNYDKRLKQKCETKRVKLKII